MNTGIVFNDAIFMLDPGYAQGNEKGDLPGSYHNNAGSFAFAGGTPGACGKATGPGEQDRLSCKKGSQT